MDITKIPIIQITKGTDVIEINTQSDVGIASGTLKLDRIIVNSELKFGELYSDKFEVEIYNIEDDLSGCPIQLFIEENNVRTVKFTGVIESSKRDRIGHSRKIIAYDWVHYHRDDNISTWWNNFWTTSRLSATIKEIRDSLISYMGFTGDSNTYVNDSITIPNNFNLYTDLKFHNIISMLCELQGTLPHIAEDGSFKFITINNTTEDITGDYEGGNCTWEDYTTNAITGVGIYSTSDDLSQLIGTNANVYRVAGNLFALTLNASDLTTLGTNLLSAISTIQFVPNTIKMKITNFDLTLGQRYNTEHGYGYVMSNAISGVCMVEQTLKSVAMGENLSESVSTRNDTMIEGAKMSKFQQTIDGFEIEVSQATQTANTALTRANGSITTDTLHYLATPLSSGVTTETAGWTTTPQSMTPTNKYLWTYHTYTYADAHTSDTTPVITGVYGEDGQQGQTGPQGPAGPTGADGISITSVTSLYYASNSSTAPTAPSSEVTTTSTSVYNTWTKGVPALTSTYNKLYTCDQVKYSNNTFTWTTPVLHNAITTAVSEINQLADEIVLKVKNDGTVALVKLDADASTGSNVLIKGDNIQLDGNVTITSGFTLNVGTIQSANYVADTSGMKITLSDGVYDSKYFKILTSGDVIIKSAIIGGANGNDGWSITTGKIESSYMYNNVTNYCGMGTYNNAWAFYAGSTTAGGGNGTFRVGHGGEMYATNATILGSITFKDSIKVYDSNKQTTSTILSYSVTAASQGIPSEWDMSLKAPDGTGDIITAGSVRTTLFNGRATYASNADYATILAGQDKNLTYSTPAQWGTWSGNGFRTAWYDTASKISNQPSQYGFLLHVGRNYGEGHQIWCTQANGDLYHRGFNAGSTLSSVAFKKILDSSNGVQSYADNTFYRVTALITFKSSNNALVAGDKGNYIWGISAWSDNRLKDNVKDSRVNALNIINNIKVREFDFIDEKYGKHEDIGYIAQELKEVIPECVVDIPISEEEQKEYKTDTLMQVEDKHLIKYLVKAVQELSKEVERLKNGGN